LLAINFQPVTNTATDMQTLIVGLGNPVLGDDGVGWRIAERVSQKIQKKASDREHVDVVCLSVGGLSLMEHLVGYERAILVDAIDSNQCAPGSISHFNFDELPNPGAGHTGSTHDTTLQTALEMGRSLGLKLPENITVIAVNIHLDYNFIEILTPPIEAAVPLATQKVLEAISEISSFDEQYP
jgi:hydrogenase maturation protease